ncbi:MAG: FtsQ-type POTRA domain-containing protein [Terracidiphilus sp.]
MQPGAPASTRGLPLDLDDDLNSAPRKGRFSAPGTPWWRPTSTWGRVFLLVGALLVASSFAYALHLCKSFLERDARFRIAGSGDIQATGLVEVSRAEMLPVFGEDIGRNVFFVPLTARRKQLEEIPWIQHATVMRLLPDQIRVSVVERQPVAFVRHGQEIGLVDANGVLLKMPPALLTKHHYSFPVLTGMDAGDPLPSRKARVELYERMMEELDANGQHLSEQLSEIDLTDPEDARVLMPEQGSDILAHFGEDHFLDRFRRYKAHIAEWRQQYPKLAAVDLRYDQQVVLQMTPGSSNEQASLAPDNSDALHSGKPMAGQLEPKAAPLAPAKHEAVKIAANVPAAKASATPAKPHASETAKAAPKSAKQKAKEERVSALAARMRDKKRADAKRAALKQGKQKPQPKKHSTSTAVQGQ